MNTLMNIILAETPEEKKAAEKAHREHIKNKPSDSEVITSFLRGCTTETGKKIIQDDEIALFDGSAKLAIKKLN